MELENVTVIDVVPIAEISAITAVELSLIVQTGVYERVVDQLIVADVKTVPVTIDPTESVDPELIDEQPVPHVGVPALPVKNCDQIPWM